MDDRKLDAALGAWGRAPMGEPAAVDRLLAHARALPDAQPATGPARWRRRAFGAGGALAAALALALVWLPPMADPAPAPADVAPTATTPAASHPDASFAMLYSMTSEEEMLL